MMIIIMIIIIIIIIVLKGNGVNVRSWIDSAEDMDY